MNDRRAASDAESRLTRRKALQRAATGAGLLATTALGRSVPAFEEEKRPRVAAIFTEFRFRSHAYNILENCFEPYLFNGELVDPGIEIVSFYADQFPANDMARDVAKRYGIPLCASIEKAMCAGGDELAVDAVLSIGEHGDYPYNELGQKQYPRKRFFDEAFAVMQRAGRYLPFFNDKHLSYRWDEARAMYDASRKHGFPMLAGSSVPLAQRMPPLDVPIGSEIEEAVSIHGGGVESYDFHALEVLQSFVEARRGGETGVVAVELIHGKEFDRARRAGRWSSELVEAAMAAEEEIDVQRQRRPNTGRQARPKVKRDRNRPPAIGDHALIVHYANGPRATVLRLGSSADRWNFACRLKGESEPRATALFNGPWGNRCLFKALSHAAQSMFRTGREPYPVERTLLVSGVLEAAMKSLQAGGRRIQTPHLDVAYEPVDFRRFRERGASWQKITPKVPQPTAFAPGDARLIRARRSGLR